MAGEPHEDAAFANSAVYTVAVTVRVRGGARRLTADRRAQAVAERLASHAARAKDVVEVTARAGPSRDGEILYAEPVAFAAANTGQPASRSGDQVKFARYRDPDFERALASLAAHHTAYRAWHDADRQRRGQVGCPNGDRPGGMRRPCGCIYCAPDDHYLARQLQAATDPAACGPPPCICGRRPSPGGGRCGHHRDVVVVALDGDADALHVLADTHQPPSAGTSA